MINARELRIGNWYRVVVDGIDVLQCQVESIPIKSSLKNGACTIDFNPDNIKPIPLTEEWLVKFGFVKQNGLGWRHNVMCGLLVFDTFFFYRHYSISVCIKHVNHLQNLYFVLTGEELTAK